MSIYRMIANLFSNRASEEEKQKLQEWKAESEANLQALSEMKTLWDKTTDLKGYRAFDEHAGWKKVENRIDRSAGSRRRRIFPWVAAAASIAILVVAFVYLKPEATLPNEAMVFESEHTMKAEILPDGSEVWLDGETQLSYLDGADARQLELRSGTAVFDVVEDLDRPFTVVSNGLTVEVTGTRFEISNKGRTPHVYVEEGQVHVVTDFMQMALSANEIAYIVDGVIQKKQNNDRNILSWQRQELHFEGERVETVFRDLSRHFDVEIEVAPDVRRSDCTLTSTFKDESLEEILEEFKLLWGMTYERTSNKLLIREVNC